MDIFRKKLTSDWIGNHFAEAPAQKAGDDDNYNRALRFVAKKFKKRLKGAGRKEKDVAIFETTAVDHENARAALGALFNSITAHNLKSMFAATTGGS